MNKKQYFLLTLLLSSCVSHSLEARFPLKSILTLGLMSGLFAAEVSKCHEKTANKPDADKTVLQKTHSVVDATLETAALMLSSAGTKLQDASTRLQQERLTLPDEIKALATKLKNSVGGDDTDQQPVSTTPAASIKNSVIIPASPTVSSPEITTPSSEAPLSSISATETTALTDNAIPALANKAHQELSEAAPYFTANNLPEVTKPSSPVTE